MAARTSRPCAFLQELNATVYKRVPGAITIAEESTSWPGVTQPTSAGGLGFGFKWNMGWMHDSLTYVARDPIHRSYHHDQLTFSMVYAFSENYVLPISHDEVVHGKGSLLRKMPGDRWQQLANVRAFLSWQWAHPGKQLLFMGTEFAQDQEWAEQRELDWGLLRRTTTTRACSGWSPTSTASTPTPRRCGRRTPRPTGFQWVEADDAGRNTVAFLRWGSDGSALVCVTNFSAVPHEGYRLGLPFAGEWTEVINTDAETYGGSGVGNLGTVTAHEQRPQRPARLGDAAGPPLGTALAHPPPAVSQRAPPRAPRASRNGSGRSCCSWC